MKTKLTLLATFFLCVLVGQTAGKPNIIVVLADDLGNADLGYRGSQIKTPHLDKLANTGVRLESYCGQQLCTPARAALMTGRYPMRHILQTAVIFRGTNTVCRRTKSHCRKR